MNRVLSHLSLAAVLGALAGCVSPPAPPGPPAPAAAAAALSSSEAFVPLDSVAASSLALAALHQHVRPDGRLEVLASLRNETGQPLRFGVACFFKTAAGAVTGPAVDWLPLALAGHATETVRFTAADLQAERFTLAARETKGP